MVGSGKVRFVETLKVAMVDIQNEIDSLLKKGCYNDKLKFLEEMMDELDSLIYEAEKGVKRYEHSVGCNEQDNNS
jgi:hypothetical protein